MIAQKTADQAFDSYVGFRMLNTAIGEKERLDEDILVNEIMCGHLVVSYNGRVKKNLDESICWMWEHRADRKEAEGCCIERATASDYIYNQMSKQVTNRVT